MSDVKNRHLLILKIFECANSRKINNVFLKKINEKHYVCHRKENQETIPITAVCVK
jgi:hypothetical protein